MNGYLKVTCSKAAIAQTQRKVIALFSKFRISEYKKNEVVPYWKDLRCAVLEYQFRVFSLEVNELKEELAHISGAQQTDVILDGDSYEIDCYNSQQSILNNHDLFFSICYISKT